MSKEYAVRMPCETCKQFKPCRPFGPNREFVCYECAEKNPVAMIREALKNETFREALKDPKLTIERWVNKIGKTLQEGANLGLVIREFRILAENDDAVGYELGVDASKLKEQLKMAMEFMSTISGEQPDMPDMPKDSFYVSTGGQA